MHRGLGFLRHLYRELLLLHDLVLQLNSLDRPFVVVLRQGVDLCLETCHLKLQLLEVWVFVFVFAGGVGGGVCVLCGGGGGGGGWLTPLAGGGVRRVAGIVVGVVGGEVAQGVRLTVRHSRVVGRVLPG